jgi:hypothetical protein
LFEPKVYKTNNIESYHLLSEDGGSFLYESKVEYDDSHLYKDEQGRAYYLVTTDISGNSKYFVEVEPQGIPIPKAEKKDKSISELIMASPRDEPLADKPAHKLAPVEPDKKSELAVQEAAEPTVPVKQTDTCFEGPEKAPEPQVQPVEPKAEVPQAPQPTVSDEAQAAVKALASLNDHKPRKKRRGFVIPIVAALIIIILVAGTAGVYVYKPGIYTSIKEKLMPNPTATPIPTVKPTPIPTSTPASIVPPVPTNIISFSSPAPSLPVIAIAINENNSSVQAFINNSSNPYGTSYNSIDIILDVFDYLNKHWTLTQGNDVPQMVSQSITTMNGSSMDYSVLMAAVIQLEGMDTRVVAAPNAISNGYDYYPEIMIATNDDTYSNALKYLQSRYINLSSPYVQQDGTDYWMSLAMGNTPGQKVDSTYAYSVNPQGGIYGV